MKKIIFTFIALMILGSLLVAQDVFKKKSNTKDYDVWGYVYHWDGHHWVTGPNPDGSNCVKMDWYPSRPYFNAYPNNPGISDHLLVDGNGFYHYNFPGYWTTHAGVVQLSIDSYRNNFDIVETLHVDIYIPNPDAPVPVPDNTIPPEQ